MRFAPLYVLLLGNFGPPLTCRGGGDTDSSESSDTDFDTDDLRFEGTCYNSNTPNLVYRYGLDCDIVQCCETIAHNQCWFEGPSGMQYPCSGENWWGDCSDAEREALCAECDLDSTTAAQVGCG